jgi:peptidoglycan/xylan/chitin deacetylase (PgdA/CDA1 family)
MSLEIALKVDVCNRRSLSDGVPGLLDLLAGFDVPASFFVAFGPDNSGKAIRRIFRPGFLKKMVRTRAPRMYGFRTLLYGTLLPPPAVGESAPDLLRRVEGAGHEVGLHGFDHVGWHDGVAGMSEAQVRASYQRAAELFEAGLGHAPRFSGVPGWQVTPTSLAVQDEFDFEFASDTREGAPFYPRAHGDRLRTLQVPTTLLTSDEILGAGEADTGGLAAWYATRLPAGGPHVIGLHAEAEGIHFQDWLREFLGIARERGAQFLRLSQVAARTRDDARVRDFERREIPGRSDPVACPVLD